jgi:uncharacterized protein YggE
LVSLNIETDCPALVSLAHFKFTSNFEKLIYFNNLEIASCCGETQMFGIVYALEKVKFNTGGFMYNFTKIKILAVSLTLLGFSGIAQAGEATLTGYGELQVEPEFVNVSVTVTSECFPAAMAVSTVNDEVANKVLAVLKSVATASGDEVTASGGFVKRYTGYNSRRNEAVCINTFRKENRLTIKTHAVADFPQMFALLQDRIYELGMVTDSNGIEKPTSFLEIGLPVAGLSLASQKVYEKNVMALAIQDAKEKFEATLALVGINSYKIINYSESSLPVSYVGDESRKAIGGQASAPVEFGKLTISKTLSVRFEFIGGNLDIL